jgi:hypothetical protein
MEIVFNKLYKIDIASDEAIERPEYKNLNNFKRYVQGMLEQISSKSPDRYYKFNSEYTEVHNLIRTILSVEEYENTSNAIARRLLDKEKEAQEDLNRKNLKKEITKGMLIVSLVRMTEDARKLIVSKVDYDEFISEMTGEISTGLSIKRKVYKAFICEVNNNNAIINISIFDTNTPVSVYWWSKFLELDVVVTDEENTKNAFHAIETDVLSSLKKTHKQDYLLLWNATIAYFRRGGEFNLSYYRDDIVGNYTPFDESLIIENVKTKIDRLPTKYKFDQRFDKVPEAVTKRFKNTLHLTREIDLIIKHDVANPTKTFKSHSDADGKYLMILSDEGYEYAEKLNKENIEIHE